MYSWAAELAPCRYLWWQYFPYRKIFRHSCYAVCLIVKRTWRRSRQQHNALLIITAKSSARSRLSVRFLLGTPGSWPPTLRAKFLDVFVRRSPGVSRRICVALLKTRDLDLWACVWVKHVDKRRFWLHSDRGRRPGLLYGLSAGKKEQEDSAVGAGASWNDFESRV